MTESRETSPPAQNDGEQTFRHHPYPVLKLLVVVTFILLNMNTQKLSEGVVHHLPSSLGDSDLQIRQNIEVRPLPASHQLAPCTLIHCLGPHEQRGAQEVLWQGRDRELPRHILLCSRRSLWMPAKL